MTDSSTELQQAISKGYIFDEALGTMTWSPEAIAGLDLPIEEKIEACAAARNKKKDLAEELRGARKVLDEQYKMLTNQIEQFNEYMLQCVESEGGRITTPTYSVKASKAEHVEVIDQELIPEDYKRQITKIKIDKTSIRKALKNGDEVPGCALVSNPVLSVRELSDKNKLPFYA